ncbi:MAG: hypothetical protein GEU87_01305 [Alphaproteobacteria bacterium]|nr:hypothetical protein [Alphaproteobacteria bacterium]
MRPTMLIRVAWLKLHIDVQRESGFDSAGELRFQRSRMCGGTAADMKILWRRSRSVLWLLAFAVCANASAQTDTKVDRHGAWGAAVKPRDPAVIIRMFDGNEDGKIDRTEYQFEIVKAFITLDQNRDDYLEPKEMPGMDKSAFDKADKDTDGRLSTYEFVTADSLKFDEIDTNSDGFVTETEIAGHQKRH